MKALLGILSVFMAVVISVTTAFCVTFNKNQDFKDIVTEELESSSVIASLEEEALKIDECEKNINDLQNQFLEHDETQEEERLNLSIEIATLTAKLNVHISNYNSLLTTVNNIYKYTYSQAYTTPANLFNCTSYISKLVLTINTSFDITLNKCSINSTETVFAEETKSIDVSSITFYYSSYSTSGSGLFVKQTKTFVSRDYSLSVVYNKSTGYFVYLYYNDYDLSADSIVIYDGTKNLNTLLANNEIRFNSYNFAK